MIDDLRSEICGTATNGGGVATAAATPRPRRRGATRPTPQRGQRKARQSQATAATASRALDPRLAWYAGLALITVLEAIEWPVALIIGVGHELTYRARTRALKELAKGIEAAG